MVVDKCPDAFRTPQNRGRPKSDFEASEIDSLSDEEIVQMLGSQSLRTLEEESNVFGGHNVVQLTRRTIYKCGQDCEERVKDPSEANILDAVFKHTTIPVPRVRRVINYPNGTNIIIMDHIPGRQLREVWPSMSLDEKLRVVFTLRGYITQLRSIRHPSPGIPGPVTSDGSARICTSRLFGQIFPERGPFDSYSAFAEFFNSRRDMLYEYRKKAPDDPSKFDDTLPLVLTHQDLNMRNIMVGDDGRLWVVDWGWSGFYPCWFEYVSMKMQAKNDAQIAGCDDPFWELMIPYICGPYYRHERWLHSMISAFSYSG